MQQAIKINLNPKLTEVFHVAEFMIGGAEENKKGIPSVYQWSNASY